MEKWLTLWLQYLILLPSAVSCYLVMRNQLRYTPRKTAVFAVSFLSIYTVPAAVISFISDVSPNFLILASLPLFLFLYYRTLRCDFSKTLAIFTGICAMQTFPIQFAHAFDAVLHPQMIAAVMSREAALFGLGAACLMAAAFAWPELRWFYQMIDRLNIPKVWYATVILSALFLIGNVLAMPQFYSTLRVARIPYLFPILEGFALTVLTLIYMLFFYGTSIILENTELKERAQLLEMQGRQYQALLEQMQTTSRLRHDFRHSLRLLASLAERGDLQSIREHISQYTDNISDTVPVHYCLNPALNALFSYYQAAAQAAVVETDWRIELPDPLPVSEIDLASLFGNIIENAIDGCLSLPEGERYFCLTSEVRYGSRLYIVSTNSFDGKSQPDRNLYASTKHEGPGLGLTSVKAIAEKYGGSAQTSCSGTEFYMDVVIRL